MKLIRAIVCFCLLGATQCRPEGPEEIPLPTKICVKTSHHGQAIPNARVYFKFNADSFPGYDQSEAYFDKRIVTGQDARACLESAPEGKHWLIAFGYDSLHFPHYVYGSMLAEIRLGTHPVVDTIFYVSE